MEDLMKGKLGDLEKEARRLQAGGRKRRVAVDLGGAALEGWENLVTRAKVKAVDQGGVLTLLVLHGGTKVEAVLELLPEPRREEAPGKKAGKV
jgi:hypothetical protein